ncbi:MAG: hypothetical protein IKS83_09730, partial [Victivallales bacterium]|nr:hypothetical protein [Victivallales bacterium]
MPQSTRAKPFEGLSALTLRFAYCVLLFIMPFRWCFVAPIIEQANYPLSALEWVFSTIWPQALLSGLVGMLLLATLVVGPPPK